MAVTKCASCGNTFFEVVTKEPVRSNYKLNFVQCSQCGTVVGVLDYFNIGAKIHDVEEKLDRSNRAIDQLLHGIEIVNNSLRLLAKK